MRTFLSVNLAEPIYQKIAEMQNEFANNHSGIRWTPPKNCHLTLKFLGDIDPPAVEIVRQALQPVAQQCRPFKMELCGLGQFPPRGPLSVVWIGVNQGVSRLLALEEQIRERLLEAGVSFDKQRFTPHLTIGRAKRDEKVFFNRMKDYERFHCGVLEVEAFYLMESILQPSGAVYHERVKFLLGPDAG